MLAFGEDNDPWNAPKPVQSRLGEFALYDEYDPRRVVRLNDDGSKVMEGNGGVEWLLNFVSFEGPEILGYVEFAPNGTPIGPMVGRNTDGDDVIFGDLGNDWIVGGTGRDKAYGGWGNDLLNADDVLGTTGGIGTVGDETFIAGETDDNTDTHIMYEDRFYGGAGLDILIGNTGGDRLIDWVGEFNSYIVPFAPFGIATVSRQVPPHLYEFLYAQALSDGVDPTRATDTGNDADRIGEPDGEMGLVTQKDHGLWQDQTGGPTDPQPGNIPGGPRDVLRTADFNDGSNQAFFIDSGVWTASSGRMQIAPEFLGGDAASVFYVDDYIPNYFEIRAVINGGKPTGGLKSNAYLIFDYQSPTDFKFAGVNISVDKMQMGYRDESGWHVVAQTPSQLKPDRDYDVLLAVNGLVATLVVNNQDVFTHVFQPRVVDGVSYNLNYGLVGLGSENSIARIDNVAVQILPPDWTYEDADDFSDANATAEKFDEIADDWVVTGGLFEATPLTSDVSISTYDLNVGFDSIIEVGTRVRTENLGGIVFDAYDADDFKFVVLSSDTDEVIIGHYSPHGGLDFDAVASWNLNPNSFYDLDISVKGTTVSVNVNGQAVIGHAFNGLAADGGFGLLSIEGQSLFDDFSIRTNDPALAQPENLMASAAPTLSLKADEPLGHDALQRAVDAAKAYWANAESLSERARIYLDQVDFRFADLPGLILGQALGSTITLDVDAAGYGWQTGIEGESTGAGVDLLTVLAHEIGHWVGHHDIWDSETPVLMSATLDAGVRVMTLNAVKEQAATAGQAASAGAPTAAAAGESALPAGNVVQLGAVVEQAVPLTGQPLLSRETLQAPVAPREAEQRLDGRFVPVTTAAAPEELRIFDAATGELRPFAEVQDSAASQPKGEVKGVLRQGTWAEARAGADSRDTADAGVVASDAAAATPVAGHKGAHQAVAAAMAAAGHAPAPAEFIYLDEITAPTEASGNDAGATHPARVASALSRRLAPAVFGPVSGNDADAGASRSSGTRGGGVHRAAAPTFLTPQADALDVREHREDPSSADRSGYKTAAAVPGVLAAVLRLFERSRDAANEVNTVASERSREQEVD
jgi:hypothetical protein